MNVGPPPPAWSPASPSTWAAPGPREKPPAAACSSPGARRRAASAWNLERRPVAVQGFGNVGSAAAELFQPGQREDRRGAGPHRHHRQRQRLRPGRTGPARQGHRWRGGLQGPKPLDDESFWDVTCDILIPAALGRPDAADRAQRHHRQKLVLEGANGPAAGADDIMVDRGILVLPDVIYNAGGVTVKLLPGGCRTSARSSGPRTRSTSDSTKIMVGALKGNHLGTPPTSTHPACAPPPRWPASASSLRPGTWSVPRRPACRPAPQSRRIVDDDARSTGRGRPWPGDKTYASRCRSRRCQAASRTRLAGRCSAPVAHRGASSVCTTMAREGYILGARA